MKKFLSFILSVITLLCLGLFAACDGLGGKTDEQEAQEILQEVLGKSWEDRTSLQTDYRIVWQGSSYYMSTSTNTLTIDENGNCTIDYFAGNDKGHVIGTFTIGAHKGKEADGDWVCYEYTIINDTTNSIVKFEIDNKNKLIIWTE